MQRNAMSYLGARAAGRDAGLLPALEPARLGNPMARLHYDARMALARP